MYDDLDFTYNRGEAEDLFDEEFVVNQRRYKERAAAAFEEDMAELRRKRRDVQDRMFDMIDLNAEIEKAKNTLGAADSMFQRHALRFDNELDEDELTLAQRIERARRVASQEVPDSKQPNVKWMKLVPVEGPPPEQPAAVQARKVAEDGEPPRGRRSYSKRKKSVSF